MDELSSGARNHEQNLPVPTAFRVIIGTAAGVFSGAHLLAVLSISKFAAIFQDMLGGQPVPALTSIVLNARGLLLVLAVALVALALATFFIRTRRGFVVAASVAVFASILSTPIVVRAMVVPLVGLITEIQQR